MTTILKIKVYNTPGVLDRIVGLFRHYGWNIDNISAGEVQQNITQIKIIFKSRWVDEQILHDKISRMEYVQSWEICSPETHIMRETVVLKMREVDCDETFFADKKIIDQKNGILIIEYTDTSGKIDELLHNVDCISCDRSGGIAISKLEE